MNRNDKKTLIILSIFFVVIIIIIMGYKYFYKEDENEIKVNEYNSLTRVSDESEFFSVIKNINKFYNGVSVNDNNYVYSLLDSQYIEQQELTKENVINEMNLSNQKLRFRGEEIYVISDMSLYLYYVKGYTENNEMDSSPFENETTKYFKLYYNISNSTFSLVPITKNEYDKKNKKNLKLSDIEPNDYNLYENEVINSKTMANYYLNSFINLMVFKPNKAYDKILVSTKNKYFGSYDTFVEYINNNLELLSSLSIKKYKKDGNKYIIYDNNDNIYTFNVKNVIDYDIEIYYSY